MARRTKQAEPSFREEMAALAAERHRQHADSGFCEAWARRLEQFAREPVPAFYTQSSRCAHTPPCPALAKEA